nr:MAG TPA: hypothetical protein [Bacteriophage sp.]
MSLTLLSCIKIIPHQGGLSKMSKTMMPLPFRT